MRLGMCLGLLWDEGMKGENVVVWVEGSEAFFNEVGFGFWKFEFLLLG